MDGGSTNKVLTVREDLGISLINLLSPHQRSCEGME
jgi:hypothetical protein